MFILLLDVEIGLDQLLADLIPGQTRHWDYVLDHRLLDVLARFTVCQSGLMHLIEWSYGSD